MYNYEKWLLYLGGEKKGKGLLNVVNNWIEDLRIYIKVKSACKSWSPVFYLEVFVIYLEWISLLFFGFLAFVLNFIPQVGSLIATVFPVLLAFLEMNSLANGWIVCSIINGSSINDGNFC